MSENPDHLAPSGPRTERWVILMAWAFAPAVAALFVPESVRLRLFAISGAIFIASLMLMIRQSRRERNERR